jgi:molecular chaperone HtpG
VTEQHDPNKHEFQIYLPGLLKVLAESLYSTKKVAIRELIQNAHDSCVRRRVETKEASYKPRIDVFIDEENSTVTIRDTGSGLTKEDVRTYLSTIGRSYTRQLGDNLSIFNPDEASQLIGQFGMGFLSAFLVASEVVLTTRSYKEGSPTLQWRSNGDVHYELEEIADAPIGTSVELHIKANASFMLNEGILSDTIAQYADFLPIPVYLNGEFYPVNAQRPPWESLDPTQATLDYIQRVFRVSNPLAVIELNDQIVDLGHDSMTIPLEGFVFIPPGSVASVQEYGDMNVFIRRMFICERQRDLLPPWARFARGVVDCTYLQPTASREELHQDDNFMFIQQAIEEQLLQGLRRIADEDPTKWKQIVRGHADVIMGWAVQDDEFFEQVADIVTFRTTRGQISLRDYLQETDNKIYYVTRQMGSLQERLLGEGHGVPVIDASWFAVTPFLKKFANRDQDVELVQLDGESNQLMRPVDDERFDQIAEFFAQREIKARIVTFKPEDVPGIIIYPKDAEFIMETRSALDSDELPGPLAGLVNDYVNRLSQEHDDDLGGTFYINASNSLIMKLAKLQPAVGRDAALMLIYQMSKLFSGRMLDNVQITEAFRDAGFAIDTLLED